MPGKKFRDGDELLPQSLGSDRKTQTLSRRDFLLGGVAVSGIAAILSAGAQERSVPAKSSPYVPQTATYIFELEKELCYPEQLSLEASRNYGGAASINAYKSLRSAIRHRNTKKIGEAIEAMHKPGAEGNAPAVAKEAIVAKALAYTLTLPPDEYTGEQKKSFIATILEAYPPARNFEFVTKAQEEPKLLWKLAYDGYEVGAQKRDGRHIEPEEKRVIIGDEGVSDFIRAGYPPAAPGRGK